MAGTMTVLPWAANGGLYRRPCSAGSNRRGASGAYEKERMVISARGQSD
jgi:hypothetical protein